MRLLLLLLATSLLLLRGAAAGRGKKYYQTLSIPEDADETAVKKAYRKAAL